MIIAVQTRELRCLYVVMAIYFAPASLFAQTAEIESLLEQSKKEKNNRHKSDLYSSVADLLYSHDFAKGLRYANEALELAVEENYHEGQAKALTAIGTYYYYDGDNVLSRRYYKNALIAAAKGSSKDFPARTYIRLSILYRQQADYDTARYYLDKAEEYLKDDIPSLLHASMYASDGLLLNEMSRNSEAIKQLKRSLVIRQKFNDSSRISYSWASLGLVYSTISMYDSAEYCFAQAQPIVDKVSDPEIKMLLNLWRGETAFARGNFDKASENYTRALGAVKKNTYKRYYFKILYKIGELYENQGAYHTAYDYLFNALTEFEKINSRRDMARALNQIGWCYAYQENFQEAIKNSDKSMTISLQITDSSGMGQSHNLKGYSLYKTGKYQDALNELNLAVIIRKKVGHWWGVSFSMYNTALTYFAMGEDQKGFDLLLQSLEIDKRIGKKSGVAFTSNELGYQYTRKREFGKASQYLAMANGIAKSIPIVPQLLNNYKNYIFLYEQQGKQAEIVRYYKLYTALKDSLSNEVNASRISKADALFQLQKKAAEIELVNKENELNQHKIEAQEARISFQSTILIIVTVVLVGVSILLFIIYKLFKSNKQAKEVLKEQNHEIAAQGERIKEVNMELEAINDQLEKRVEERTSEVNKAYTELETFFYRTSHDFRRPLTTYLGLVEVAKSTVKDENAIDLFEKVKETTLGLDGMLRKLQSISDSTSIEDTTIVELDPLISRCFEKYERNIGERGIQITKSITVPKVNANYQLMELVIQNLIENAIQFSTPDSPYVKISASQVNGDVSLVVEDNGHGIPEEYQSRIFTMYYRANSNSRGNGLGLYIAKRAVDKLGGSLSFTSVANKGSSFKFTVPA